MTLDRAVFAFAGAMVLISLGLALWLSPYFLWLTALIGVNLFQAAFTGVCPAAILFSKFGMKPGVVFHG